MKKKIKVNKKVVLGTAIAIILCSTIYIIFFSYRNPNGVESLSSDGLGLLKDYEGYDLISTYTDTDGDACQFPYDLDDGSITFGLGVTFPSEQEGMDYINKEFDAGYKVGDCIKVDDLNQLLYDAIAKREKQILKFDSKHRLEMTQQQFDAIFIMFYLNEDTVLNKNFVKLLKNDELTYKEFTNYFIGEYKQFDQWNDFGEGWTKRINDAADVYFKGEYDRQY